MMLEVVDGKLPDREFFAQREQILQTWPTGQEVEGLESGIAWQKQLPQTMNFADALDAATREERVLLQPRAGVALVEEHIKLLKSLEPECDLLPTTIDAYTRQNQYVEAQRGIDKSLAAGYSMLNGFPAVNHGVAACRQVVAQLTKPVEIRHGTPDARLLAEIALASGFTSFEGGGISYNIPYAKKVSLTHSIAAWQYVDRLVGKYEEAGVRINREPFGPLSGTLVPPFISHSVAIIEGLLALEQGVKSLTLGYGQAGNLIQDVAAMISLRQLAESYFQRAGYNDYALSTVLHQWMGGFPEDEAKAFSVISWGAATAALSRATKVIVKTPHEALGIPTREANVQGLRCTSQTVNMLNGQFIEDTGMVKTETELIFRETACVLDAVLELGGGSIADGAVRAFEAGLIDVPFAPAVCNAGRLIPVRDNNGAIRVLERGDVPLAEDVYAFHKQKIKERADTEKRDSGFQMVIDDIYAISKGRLIGRPK